MANEQVMGSVGEFPAFNLSSWMFIAVCGGTKVNYTSCIMKFIMYIYTRNKNSTYTEFFGADLVLLIVNAVGLVANYLTHSLICGKAHMFITTK